MAVKKAFRNPVISILVTSLAFAIIIYFFHDYGIADFAIVTILAFLASDVLSLLFIRGGHGILQITAAGTKCQPKGYGFIVFFISIIIVAVVVNLGTEGIVLYLSEFFSNFLADIAVAFVLSVLVYVDMYLKFYNR